MDVSCEVAMRLTTGVAGYSIVGPTPLETTVEMDREFLDAVKASLDAVSFAGKATPEIVVKTIVAITNRATPVLPSVPSQNGDHAPLFR